MIREPERGRFDDRVQRETMAIQNEGTSQVISNLKTIFKESTFVVIVIGSSLRFLGGYSLGFWAPKFF